MLKQARQHQIVERIFGSFLPSSFPSNLPLRFSSSFSFSNEPSLFPIPFFLFHSYLHFLVPYLFPLLVPWSLFFHSFLRLIEELSFSQSLHVFFGLYVFLPSLIAPQRTIRPALLKLSLSASLPSCSVLCYLTSWLTLFIISLVCFAWWALSRSYSRDSTPL